MPRPSELPSLNIREYEPGDEHAILETFNRVFSQIDPTFQPRTLEAWRWQFLDNPSGKRIYLALTEEGQVVSQYAGIGQRVLLRGEEALFSQSVDSMTDPAWRLVLQEPGFFVLTATPYGEQFGGGGDGQDTFMWGLPVWSAWRVGKTFLDYEVLRTQLKLATPLDRLRLEQAGGVEVEEVADFPDDVEPVGRARAEAAGAFAVRDRAQLSWRFTERPDCDYSIGIARRAGVAVGYAVYRKGLFDRTEDEGLVCDWVVPPGETGAHQALLAWLRDKAAATGAERLVTVFPDTAPEWHAFQRQGFHAAGTMYFIVGRSWVKRVRMRWLFENWVYTLGDTDLV
ncbi:MAG: GNAT family N-acetyltransferase [Planctomycetota bacterium]